MLIGIFIAVAVLITALATYLKVRRTKPLKIVENDRFDFNRQGIEQIVILNYFINY